MSYHGPDPVGAIFLSEGFADERAVTQALDRLFDLAASDTGQARRVANFLLAWWNAQDNGGFDLADLFGVDHAVAADMAVVFLYLGGHHGAIYPDQLGYEDKIVALVHQWRLHETAG